MRTRDKRQQIVNLLGIKREAVDDEALEEAFKAVELEETAYWDALAHYDQQHGNVGYNSCVAMVYGYLTRDV